jgi:hypothetical protein
MQGDIKCQGVDLSTPPEKARDKNEMGRTADGKKFGYPLNNAEDDSLHYFGIQ